MKNIFLLLVVLIVLSASNTKASYEDVWNKAQDIINNLDPVSFSATTYEITDFGAVGDGATPCKDAFDSAITQCSESGGGTIKVAAGKYYLNGPLVFKSNVHIELEKGAELSFSIKPQDYLPAVLTRWEGTELYNYSPLIYAYHVNNIALTGEGTINGNGSKFFRAWKRKQNPDKAVLRKMGKDLVPVYERLFGEGHFLRPGFFEPVGCTNVRLEGITILDSPFWVIHPIYCNNVIVCGVEVISHNPNNDGCDPESCKNVLIEDCVFSTGDDAIAIKAGRDNDAWRVGCPTENVVIRNCTFSSKINGVCIGSEIAGGVRNIFIENIEIPKSANAIYFKSNLDRGGYIEHVYIRNIQADSVHSSLIRFEPNYKGEKSAFHPTRFQSFYIENVSCHHSKNCGIYLAGIDNYPLKNITLKHVEVQKAIVPYCLKNGISVLFDDVKVNGEKLPKIPSEQALVRFKTH